jgi:hypothetical protein
MNLAATPGKNALSSTSTASDEIVVRREGFEGDEWPGNINATQHRFRVSISVNTPIA